MPGGRAREAYLALDDPTLRFPRQPHPRPKVGGATHLQGKLQLPLFVSGGGEGGRRKKDRGHQGEGETWPLLPRAGVKKKQFDFYMFFTQTHHSPPVFLKKIKKNRSFSLFRPSGLCEHDPCQQQEPPFGQVGVRGRSGLARCCLGLLEALSLARGVKRGGQAPSPAVPAAPEEDAPSHPVRPRGAAA